VTHMGYVKIVYKVLVFKTTRGVLAGDERKILRWIILWVVSWWLLYHGNEPSLFINLNNFLIRCTSISFL
jgi:hypothetical protein